MFSNHHNYQAQFQSQNQTIQKRLDEDFLAYQYLNQNPQNSNFQKYSQLINSLILQKKQKRKKFQLLNANFHQNYPQRLNCHQKPFSTLNHKKSNKKIRSFHPPNQQLQQKISAQKEVKKYLQNQIVQIKKSLILLKGDIDHLIDRNESAKLLQTKISKVKIAADDQFKKVELAFGQDKQQFKIRVSMQKKFTKKVKNVSLFESSALSKLKKKYVDSILKKKEINNRLNYIQKVSSFFQRAEEKERFYNQKNQKTLILYFCLQKLANTIKKVSQNRIQLRNSKQNWQVINIEQLNLEFQEYELNIFQNLKNMKQTNQPQTTDQDLELQSKIQMVTEQNLIHFQKVIIDEYRRVNQEIQSKAQSYNIQAQKTSDLTQKLDILQNQIKTLQSDFSEQLNLKHVVTSEMKSQYNKKIHHLADSFKTIFLFLQYIDKHLHYLNQSQINQRKPTNTNSLFFSPKSTQSTTSNLLNQFKPYSTPNQNQKQVIQSQLIVCKHKNYISELCKIYNVLIKDQEEESTLQNIQADFYDYLQSDINCWLESIKQSSTKERTVLLAIPRKQKKQQNTLKFRKSSSKLRQNRVSVLILPKTLRQIEQEQKNQIIQQNLYVKSLYIQHQPSKQQQMKLNNLMTSSQKWIQIYKKNLNNQLNKSSEICLQPEKKIQKRRENVTKHEEKQAERVKFVKKIDKNYFKMLKSTLKMENQNARKNYLFLRTFKRSKFSPHDEILQQKRFQCSFSMLFAPKKSNSTIKQNIRDENGPKSFFKQENFEKRISKINERNLSFYQKNN